jgi:hypothetical protein
MVGDRRGANGGGENSYLVHHEFLRVMRATLPAESTVSKSAVYEKSNKTKR